MKGRIGIGVFVLTGGAVSDDFQLDKIQTHLGRGVWANCRDYFDLV